VETQNRTDEVASALAQLRFLKGSLRTILAWPLAAVVFAALVWTLVLSHLDAERERARSQTHAAAQSLARSYAEQLSRTVEQLDGITRNVAHYWRHSEGGLRLESQVNEGLYPDDPAFSVGIFDRNGHVATSLRPHPAGVDVHDRPYFADHRDGKIDGLHIEMIQRGRITGKPTVIVTRALTDADGRFDGIVYVSVPPAFLAAFYDKAAEGDNDALAVVDHAGHFLAARMGRNVRRYGELAKIPAVFPSPQGTLRLPGRDFLDGRARIVSWDTVQKYGLVSVVGLDEDDAYAAYDAQRRDYMGMAVAATFLLLLGCVIGCTLTARLVWRKHHEATITETYRLAIEGAREGFFMARALYGHDSRITDFVVETCNEQGASMLGHSKVHLIGVRFSQLYPGRVFERVMTVFCDVMDKGFEEGEFRMRRDGGVAWIHRRLVRSGGGVAITLRDISEAKTHELMLQNLANTDSLTRLPNRYWLTQHLPRAIEEASRRRNRLAVLYLDLDDFKDVNNTIGHDAGDEVLRQAARRIQSVLRPGDQAVRLGGDEFTVLAASMEAPNDAVRIAGRIIDVLKQPFRLAGGYEAALNASVGISLFPEDGATADALLQHADTAMYAAKNAGKGRFAFYSKTLTDQILDRIGTERALRQATESGQFALYYQPRVNADTGRLVSMEALVRWQHPERGIVPPSEFIPLAEETGLIVQIGDFVIDRACAQIAAWRRAGLDPAPLSVNVSPLQFARGRLVDAIAESAGRHGIAASMLEIEITESCMMHDTDKVAAEIAAIKAMGVRISVDDFGTGYSSLSQLQRLDLDVLKVDKSFTSELVNGRHGEAFFMTIVSMAHILNMQVVAEGVETREQLAALQALGCNEIQGYLVSKPVNADAAAAFLGKHDLLQECRPALHCA
jgi:diguanylate cyclase (GGDEF)-like protein